VLVVVAFVAWFVAVLGDDDTSITTGPGITTLPETTEVTEVPTTETPEPTTLPTTTPTTEPTTVPTTAVVPVDTSTAVWPWASSTVRYTDPVAAARGFAVDFVGFTDPVVGAFQQGDSRSGEVEVRPVANGPVTTVFVRQLGTDGTWWVLGSATANIQLTSPSAGAVVTSPVTLAGTSTAFEANVSVAVHQDGSTTPLAETFVMGGSMGEMAPFTGEVAFTAPSAEYGAIVLSTASMEDGRMWEASVVRVRFG
jgi:hypothetical protein